MCDSPLLTYNISQNGTNDGWYWEVIAPDQEVLARGLASSSEEARAEAKQAGAAYVLPPAVTRSGSPVHPDYASL